jgi:hypothetical protein
MGYLNIGCGDCHGCASVFDQVLLFIGVVDDLQPLTLAYDAPGTFDLVQCDCVWLSEVHWFVEEEERTSIAEISLG